MLLKVKGLYCKPHLRMHEYTLEPPPGDPWDERKPKNLIPLGEAMWPDFVKEDIAQQFKNIGVQDPMRQKLVEPFARPFGGKGFSGKYRLEDVNWEMVMDYFRWEASAWDIGDDEEKDKAHMLMVAEIKAKYGGMFNHQMVYSDGRHPF